MANQKDKKPAYSLKSLRFEHFKGIKLIELKNLPEGAPWIFLTGENGFGKTSVLQAIASSLTEIEEHTFKYFPEQLNSELVCELHGHSFEFSFHKKDYLDFLFENKKKGFKFLACYGSSRLDSYIESDIKQSVISSLYDSTTLLENIEYQLSRWYTKQKDKEFSTKYETTKRLLIDLLQVKDIKVDFKTDQVSYIEQDEEGNAYKAVSLSELAAGYRSLVIMIGDMILRLFRTQPDVLDPKELKGIVIIDEFDLHFHPKWQKRLPGLLSKHFPYIQFIVSTHSPIPLLGAPKGSVFLTVQRTEETGVTLERLNHLEKELPTLTPNLLLNSSIFGYAELFSSQFNVDSSIRTEDTIPEVVFNEQLRKSMEKGLSPEKKEALRKLMKKG